MKKKVLVDLCWLDQPYCGFGQISINYAKLFREIQLSRQQDFDIVFLLPYSFRKNNVDMTPFSGVDCYFEETKLHHIFHCIPNKLPQVDLWHSVNQFCRRFPDSSKTKQILTIHDYNFLFEETSERKKELLDQMQKKIDRANAVTFVSYFAEQQVRENSRLDGKLTRVIYNGVEALASIPQHRPDFVTSDKPFFFALGQFLPKKKFDVLLDVMKYFPDKELYICGNELIGYQHEIQQRIDRERINNVHIPGGIGDEYRAWLFAHCQAYLFPSIGEGFGLPAIEAMQFGKPVFASNHQSLPEIVGDYGYIWTSFDVAEMAQVIKDGLNDFYSDESQKQRVIEYASTFSYEKHVEEYIKLYKEMLEVD